MIYAPFFMRIDYSTNKEFELDSLENFFFLKIHMTLPLFIFMVLGLYFFMKYME